MKILSFSVILLFATGCAFAQATYDRDSFFKKLKKLQLRCEAVKPEGETRRYQLQFVHDNRPDTNRLGVFVNQFGRGCELTAAKSVKQIFREHLQRDSSTVKIGISIEEFWMINTFAVDVVRQVGMPNRAGLIFKAKIYTGEGEAWQPLVMIDSTLVSTRLVENGEEGLVEKAIELTVQQVGRALEEGRFKKRNCFSRIQLDSIWQQRYQLPIYKDSIFPRGVYLTAEDLRQNLSTDLDFHFEYTDEQMPMVYTKGGSGIESPAHSIAAVSDGKLLHLVYFGHAFPVLREGRALYCLGLTSFRDRGASLPLFLPLGGGTAYGMQKVNARVRQVLSPLLVNVETGTLYY